MIAAETPFRRLGDVAEDAFAAALTGTPQEREARTIHRAIPGFTRLYLLHSYVEKRHDTVYKQLPPWAKNALALKARGYPLEAGNHNGYATFRSYADSARTLVGRFADPRLPYAADPEMALLDYVNRYCGVDERDPDTGRTCDPDEYVAVGAGYVNALAREEPDVAGTPRLIDLATAAGRADYNRLYPDAQLSPAEVADLLASRTPFATGRPEGICLHVQEGQTKWSVKEHAGPRQASANAYLNLDGTIVLAVSRSYGAWTQGIDPAKSHPDDRGKAFLDRFGQWNANTLVLSIEFEGDDEGPHPDAQLDAGAWLVREWQKAHPHVTPDRIFKHANFDVVNRSHCPGWLYGAVLERLGGAPPPAYAHDYPPGYDAEICAAIWSALKTGLPAFDPTERGTVSRIWVEERVLAPIVYHFRDSSDGREIFAFASGESVGRLNKNEAFRPLV